MNGFRTAPFWLVMACVGCSTVFTPAAAYLPHTCSVDDDCADPTTAMVCELQSSKPTCIKASDATLIIGESAPLSGTNQALGTAMKLGIDMAFKEQNAAGGVRGRMLQLDFRDDAYQPDIAESAARALIDVVEIKGQPPMCPSTSMKLTGNAVAISSDALSRGPNAVLAILGNVGTPTTMRSAPIALETGTVFFGAFTGASTLLRDTTAGPCERYIFNVRASYAEEAQATMEFFQNRGITDLNNLISFDQNDSFGQAGYDGLVAAYKSTIGPFPPGTDSTTPIFRQRYDRNNENSVPAMLQLTEDHLNTLLANAAGGSVTVGIMMTDTYGAAAQFIQGLRTWQFVNDTAQTQLQRASKLHLFFSNISFVGADALADRLKSAGLVPLSGSAHFTDNVVVSQVVPNYQSDASEVVTSYLKLMMGTTNTPSFTSLEGYVSARVFIAGLLLHKGPFTAASLVDTFETLPDLALGIGGTSGFSTTNHQYSNSVWGTQIKTDGSFQNLYFWSKDHEIQFYE